MANPTPAIALVENVFDVQAGVIVEGKLLLSAAGEQRRGLYIECDKGRGAAVLLDCDGIASFGTIQADGSDFKAEKTVNREMPSKASGRIGQIMGGEATALSDLAAWR